MNPGLCKEKLLAREVRIISFLRKKSLRQSDFARKYGLSREAVSSHVKGSRVNNPDVVAAFAAEGFTERRRSDGSLAGGPRVQRKRVPTTEVGRQAQSSSEGAA